MALKYMFLGQLFAKTTKNDLKTLFEKSKLVKKIKISKMGKFGCFKHVLCHNSAIFEDIDLKFCTHVHQPLPSNILDVFFVENFAFKGKMKYKILRILFFRNFQNLKNPR